MAIKPDNTFLLACLKQWEKQQNENTFKDVIHHLLEENTYLYIPTDEHLFEKEIYSEKALENSNMKFSSVINKDGLLAIAVFSTETALKMWAKRDMAYFKLETKALLGFCDRKQISRIIINAGQPDVFVLNKTMNKSEKDVPQAGVEMRFWTPQRPISGDLLDKLIMAVANVSTISEVYHYGVTRNNKHSLVLSVKLDTYSEEAQKAALFAMDGALKDTPLELPTEVLFLRDPQLYEQSKKIKDALIYKRV